MILEKKEEISQFLEKNLEIDEKKKNKFGEVNTPEILIQDMLDKIPSNIWKDPIKKWLDPAAGIGSFHIFVYERLVKSLESWEPNFKKRHNHIIENMLYMCEINPENVNKAKKIFGENANIQKCDFLNSKYPDFEIKTFDIILGNPPFNANQEAIGKKGGGNSLWPDFVEKSLSLLNPKGLLVFVHPSAWRKPEKKGYDDTTLFKKMSRDYQIEYLEIHSKQDGLKMFGVQTRYDLYILKNTPCFKKTIIKDEIGNIVNIDLRKWEFLPNCYYGEVQRLLSNKNPINVIYSRNQFGTDREWTKEKESKEYKYPLIHSTPMGQPRMYWTNTNTPPVKNQVEMFGQKKVIFGESGINNVILDVDGKYGMTQGAIGLEINNKQQGILYKKALESEGFERILKALNFGNFRIDWRIFLYIRKDFYKYLGKLEKNREKSKRQNKTKQNKTMKKLL
jgi:tRNA1(Val) A37 N6-methylase TrmN6